MPHVHVTRSLLDAVVEGQMPARLLADTGWQQLVTVCPVCRAAVRTWRQSRASTAPELALETASHLAGGQARESKEKQRSARRDLRSLLKTPHEARLVRVERALYRFRGVTVAHLLLETARHHMPDEPVQVYELAETAHFVLKRTRAEPGVAELFTRSVAFMAAARCAAGDFQGAEQRFGFARSFISNVGVIDTIILAEVDWLEGALRKEQRRFEEAEELLVRSMTLYQLGGEEAATAWPLVTLGLLEIDRQCYREASTAFRAALRTLRPSTDLRLYCSAHHDLALTLCARGEHEEAARTLAVCSKLYRRHPELYARSRVAWLEGRIAAGLGRLEEAETSFLQIRQELATDGKAHEAAMVALDLALVYLRQGRTADLAPLAEEAPQSFAAQEIHREAHAAMLLFRDAVRQKQVTAELIAKLRTYLERARTNPEEVFSPTAN